MKSLEALEIVKSKHCGIEMDDEELSIIEKELKALEIIKQCILFERITSGQVDVHYWFTLVSKEVDKKDLDLLKEVLKNE